MKIKFEEKIYDVVDGYSQGYIIEKLERGYRYVGKLKRQCEVIDNSPIEYIKSKQFLAPKITKYSKTIFIDKDHISGEIEQHEDTIVVYNNVVVFFSPAKHTLLILDIAKTKHSENKYVWGFERHYDDGTISLHPSIRYGRTESCEHFFIKRNKVVSWQRDSFEMVYIKKSK